MGIDYNLKAYVVTHFWIGKLMVRAMLLWLLVLETILLTECALEMVIKSKSCSALDGRV